MLDQWESDGEELEIEGNWLIAGGLIFWPSKRILVLIKWSGIRHSVRLHDFGGLPIENCVGIEGGMIQPTYLALMESLITI